MKYIVELEDEPYMREDGVNYYTCKSARWYKLGETVINRLTPYTEPDRKAIEDEVWGLVGVIANMDNNDYGRVFGCIGRWTLLSKKTYQEVKAKYDAWKEQKEEIHVGDEVQYSLAGYEYTFIVFGKENDTLYGIRTDEVDMDDIYAAWDYCHKSDSTLVKTGRHFDEVDELLKKMRGEQE